MKLMVPRCPACRRMIPSEDIWVEPPFRCWACGQELQIASRYEWLTAVVSLSLSMPLAFILGMKGLALLFGLLVGWIPFYVVLLITFRVLIAPRLEKYQPNEREFLTLFRK